MVVSMDRITEENYTTFYNRIVLIDAMYGLKQQPIKLKDVKRMIGLEVNVQAETSSQFLKRFKKFV